MQVDQELELDSRAILRRHGRQIALVTGAVVALLTWRIGMSAALPAYIYIAVIGVVLGTIDLVSLRLPDRIVLPSYGVAIALLAGASAADGTASLYRALMAMVLAFMLYFLLAFI